MVVVGADVGGVVVEFDAESSEHGEGKRGDGECFVVMLYVCKGGKRKEANGEGWADGKGKGRREDNEQMEIEQKRVEGKRRKW